MLKVEGTFGLAVLDENEPDKIVAARRGSPLLLGISADAIYVASDATAVVGYTRFFNKKPRAAKAEKAPKAKAE